MGRGGIRGEAEWEAEWEAVWEVEWEWDIILTARGFIARRMLCISGRSIRMRGLTGEGMVEASVYLWQAGLWED